MLFLITNSASEEETRIRSESQLVQDQLGVKIGRTIPVGFDGQFVRCGPFTWSIDSLIREVEAGYWSIDGQIDLSDPVLSAEFAEEIEMIKKPDTRH